MVILTSTMLPTQLSPNHLILLNGPEQLFQSIMLENKFLLYLQLNKKCFIHILQKK